jgi:iron complex outermembrane receptor protein
LGAGASAVRAVQCIVVVSLAGTFPCASLSQTVTTLPPIDVVAPSPLAGPGIDRDKIPGIIDTLSADDVARSLSYSITDALSHRVPGVSLTDVQGNGFVQALRYRGFAASSLQGTPQGIAVYLNGMRINEAFGDTVNWDLIPTNAIDRADIWTNNPVFGLNALGGAVSIQMKNGFTYQGREAEVQGGSFGRLSGSVQYGGQKDNFAVYAAAQGLTDDGWRYQSPGKLKRFYGDLGWKGDKSEIHVSAGTGSNFFGVVGPTPIQLLDLDRKSIYTWPQTTRNEAIFAALNGKFDLFDAWSMQAATYARKFRQRHVDGNDADVEECGLPLAGTLCLNDAGFPGLPKVNFQIRDANSNPVAFAGAAVPYGTVDRTSTDALTVGASLQFTNDAKLFGHGNYFTAGGSIDRSWIQFGANSELGFIFPDLSVVRTLRSRAPDRSSAPPGTSATARSL